MALPPLYKFLDVQGAKLTLGNGTFKHAKPSDFNDTEDLTIQSIFPEETEEALKKLSSGSLIDVIIKHINDPPTCPSPLKEKVALIQRAVRTNPIALEAMKAERAKDDHAAIYDVAYMRARAIEQLKIINEYMQDWRILCVTIHNNSEVMWEKYAENHKGIAVRVTPNTAKGSKFERFQPVIYRAARPSLYDDTLKFMEDSLFGNLEERLKIMLDKIIYSKTLDWKDEGEYRLAIPIREGEEPWDTLPYHPNEVTEIYLGMSMDDADKTDILAKAKALNPQIVIFQAKRNEKNEIVFG